MKRAGLRRTRQQTLTQIDFVKSTLTEEDDPFVLTGFEDDEPKRKRRKQNDQKPPAPKTLRKLDRDKSDIRSQNQETMTSPKRRPKRIKTECLETPEKVALREVPSSQSPPDSLSPNKSRATPFSPESPLKDRSINAITSTPRFNKNRRVDFKPELKVESSLGWENENSQVSTDPDSDDEAPSPSPDLFPSATQNSRGSNADLVVIEDSEAESDFINDSADESDYSPTTHSSPNSSPILGSHVGLPKIGRETQTIVTEFTFPDIPSHARPPTPDGQDAEILESSQLLHLASSQESKRDGAEQSQTISEQASAQLVRNLAQHGQSQLPASSASNQLLDSLAFSSQYAQIAAPPPPSSSLLSDATQSGRDASMRYHQNMASGVDLFDSVSTSQILPESLIRVGIPSPPPLTQESDIED
ncbi:MAG: hypothetical protein M1825_005525 [Sarcosagium campestre]|nr:MAG: hypothetical protein M1825_005525 [Sarcosagium campestre]